MEDIDEHLLIANIEVSCWKDQLKQVASELLTTNTFHAIQSISFLNQTYNFKTISHFVSYTVFRDLQKPF